MYTTVWHNYIYRHKYDVTYTAYTPLAPVHTDSSDPDLRSTLRHWAWVLLVLIALSPHSAWNQCTRIAMLIDLHYTEINCTAPHCSTCVYIQTYNRRIDNRPWGYHVLQSLKLVANICEHLWQLAMLQPYHWSILPLQWHVCCLGSAVRNSWFNLSV